MVTARGKVGSREGGREKGLREELTTGYFAVGVLCKTCVQDSIRDLIT